MIYMLKTGKRLQKSVSNNSTRIMKKPISATIDEELIEWLNSQTEDRTRYRNKSHIIEVALDMLRKESRKTKQK